MDNRPDNPMLRRLSDGIWTASGPVVTAVAGFHYPTRMVVIRLRDDRLWVWSPVSLDEALKREIDALGLVAHIVAPNSLHDLSLSDWQSAFPAARLHVAPGLAARRPDLTKGLRRQGASFAEVCGDVAELMALPAEAF